MTETTRVITVEITQILKPGDPIMPPEILKKSFPWILKWQLHCDDAVVTNVQDFEMEVTPNDSN